MHLICNEIIQGYVAMQLPQATDLAAPPQAGTSSYQQVVLQGVKPKRNWYLQGNREAGSPNCLQSTLWEVQTKGEFTHQWLKFPATKHKKSLMSSVPKPQLQDVGTSPCIIVGQEPMSIHLCANTRAFFVVNLWKPQALVSLFLPLGTSHLLFSSLVSCV